MAASPDLITPHGTVVLVGPLLPNPHCPALRITIIFPLGHFYSLKLVSMTPLSHSLIISSEIISIISVIFVIGPCHRKSKW